jgi:hypothetical protein
MLIFAGVRFRVPTLSGVPTAFVGVANPTGMLNKYLLFDNQKNFIACETLFNEELASLNF